MIRAIPYPGARAICSTRDSLTVRISRQGHDRDFTVTKGPPTCPGNSKPRATVGIGTRDLCIGGHPVVDVCLPLFGRQKGKKSGQRVHRKCLPRRKGDLFARDIEAIPLSMIADKVPIAPRHLDVEIVKDELI